MKRKLIAAFAIALAALGSTALADNVVTNVTQGGSAYADLCKAFKNATSGDTLMVLCDFEYTSGSTIGTDLPQIKDKSLTVDFNKKTVKNTPDGVWSMRFDGSSATRYNIKFKNGTLIANEKYKDATKKAEVGKFSGGLRVDNVNLTLEDFSLTVYHNTCIQLSDASYKKGSVSLMMTNSACVSYNPYTPAGSAGTTGILAIERSSITIGKDSYVEVYCPNGAIQSKGSAVNVYGAITNKYSGSSSYAIYNQAGSSTKVHLYEGSIISSASSAAALGANGGSFTLDDGAFVENKGTGVVVDSGAKITVTVKDGAKLTSAGNSVIKLTATGTSQATLSVKGGTLTAGTGKNVFNIPSTLKGFIEGGLFKGNAMSTDLIKAQEGKIAKWTQVEDGYVKPDYDDAVVKIGDKLYATLNEAAAASQDGDTVTLLKDITTTARVYFDQNNDVTVDLNGKTISSGADECFVMGEKGEPGTGTLTITGNGSVVQTYADEDADVVWARLGNVVISNGYYEVNGWCQCVYATRGSKVDIYGGTFKNVSTKTESKYGDVLNVNNETSQITDIQCYGGSYSKDPSFGDDYMGPTFVKSGYYSVKTEEKLWTVQDATGLAAAIGSKGYSTLAAAAAAAKDGETVTLLADATADGVTCDANVTLDINGKTLTVATAFNSAKDLTLVNNGGATGGFVVNGAVNVNGGTLDASALAVAAGGVIPGKAGGINVAKGATFVMMSEWAGYSPNWLAANRAGFLTAADGGMVKMGSKTYTAQNGLFGTANTVAKATITAYGVTYTETFDTLAAAVAAANAGTTVTAVKGCTEASALTFDKALTFDFDGCEVTIAGVTVASDVTLKNSKLGYQTAGSGWLKLTGPAAVAAGATLDMSQCPLGEDWHGIHNDSIQGGGFDIASDATVTFITGCGAYENAGKTYYSPNYMYANLPAFFGGSFPVAGAIVKFTNGTTWTSDGTMFVLDGAVAKTDLKGIAKNVSAETCNFTDCYATLQAAFDAVQDGETVTLLANIADGQATLTNAVAITLDLAGKTMNCTTQKDPNDWYGYTLRVNAGQLTIDDTVGGGKVLNDYNDSALRCCAPTGGEAACPKLIVKAGTFQNDSNSEGTVYVGPTSGAVIEIEGGTFVNLKTATFKDGNASAVLNVNNAMVGETPMVVKGGFFSVDPSLGDDYFGISYVAPGYASYKQGDVWAVAAAMPKATVAENTIAAAYGALDAAYTFTTNGVCPAQPVASKNVDYVVSFDNDVEAGAIRLAAVMESGWTNFPSMKFTKNTPYPLIASMQKTVSVAEMYAMGSFTCGISNINVTTETKMTVQLVMADTVPYVITNVTYTITPKQVGPTPAPGSQTTVVEDPQNPGTYVVTPTGENTAVVIQGVKDTDTLVINGGKVDSLTVDAAPKAVKVLNTAGAVDITAAVKGWNGNTFDAKLDGTKSVKGVPVTPTLIAETATEKPLVVGTDVSTKVQTIEGLTYTLKRGTTIGTYADTADTKVGTGSPVTLTDSSKPADKAFYVIEVTK